MGAPKLFGGGGGGGGAAGAGAGAPLYPEKPEYPEKPLSMESWLKFRPRPKLPGPNGGKAPLFGALRLFPLPNAPVI